MPEKIRDALIGAIAGAVGGLGLSLWGIPEILLFPGDLILGGTLLGALCGFVWGDDFFDWLRDYWHRLP